jgi:septum formation protein
MTRPALILASASPRRVALLEQAGLKPDATVATDIDESARPRELPRLHAERLAEEKARAAVPLVPPKLKDKPHLILAADTVVACGRRILPKAENDADVRRCLDLMSGRSHQVMTAIALMTREGQIRSRVVLTRVTFKRLSTVDVDAYVTSREGIGKAGGYAIQGRAGALITRINGSYTNVVGLPLAETMALLAGHGVLATS